MAAASDETIIDVGVGLIWFEGRLAVGVRPPGSALEGRSEFPGGKCHSGESPVEAAVRECEEETGLDVEALGLRLRTQHRYTHGNIDLHFVDCKPIDSSELKHPFEWIAVADLGALHFPDGNAEVLADLLRRPFPTGVVESDV